MKKVTRAWLRKAEDDFQTAQSLLRTRRQLHDQICFHCQQAAEKYLKAVLQERGAAVPRTHDLPDLNRLLLAYHATLRSLRRRLVFLTQFAVDFRYPGVRATARQAQAAFRNIERVRHEIRHILHLP